MKKVLIVLMILLLSVTVAAAQQGKHNGNVLNVGIEYKNFNGYMDYSHLKSGFENLPVYYIGQNMDYNISVENGKKSKLNHLVILVTHRNYESQEVTPGYEIDAFSGLPYHNIIYLEDFRASEEFDLSYWVPHNTTPGAGQTDVIIYRGYDLEDSGENLWSFGRIIFEGTIGYFCP